MTLRRAARRAADRAIAAADRFSARGTRLLRGGGVRRAWLVLATLAALPVLGFGTVQAASVLAHEEHTEVVELDAAGISRLEIDNQAGSVAVVGVDGAAAITIRARVSEGLRDTGHVVGEREGVVFVTGTCPLYGSLWCDVDYTIEMPADMPVSVDGQGRVSVAGVHGGVTAHSDQSTLELARVGGTVRATADQGRIEAADLTARRVDARADQGRLSLEFVASPHEVVAEADQGSIHILLPDEEGVAYATDTDADQGAVDDRIRQDPGSRRSITAKADQGNITIAYAPS